jgi:hypothetical protein
MDASGAKATGPAVKADKLGGALLGARDLFVCVRGFQVSVALRFFLWFSAFGTLLLGNPHIAAGEPLAPRRLYGGLKVFRGFPSRFGD